MIPENEDYDRYWVTRFMIGADFQGKGYGKKAMQKIISKLAENEDCQRIRLSAVPENQAALRFYENIGFVLTEEFLEDEQVMDYFIERNYS